MDGFEFHSVGRVVFGVDQVDRLAELAAPLGTRALVVTNAGQLGDGGLVDRIGSLLLAGGLSVEVVRQHGEPTVEDIDRSATRTADHPAGVAGLAGVDPAGQQFILVTTPYHSTRAIACFEHFGYRHVLARAPDWDYHGQFGPVRSDWHRRWIDLPAKLREIVGLWYYRLRGWA